MENNIVIGIDPGVNTGIAIYDRDKKKIVKTALTGFVGAFEIMQEYTPDDVALVIVECPRSKSVWHNKATSRAAQNRTAVNVGSVIREAELLVEMAKYLGHTVETMPPQGKVSAEIVKAITGYDSKPNNGHVRDSIMLAWGR